MRHRTLRILAALTCLVALEAGAQVTGDHSVRAPDGWRFDIARQHNIDYTGLHQVDGAGKAAHVRFSIPLVVSDLDRLVAHFVEGLDVDVTRVRPTPDLADAVWQELDGTGPDGASWRVSVVAIEEGTYQHLYAFSAPVEVFEALGSADFPVSLFSRHESVAALGDAAARRQASIAGNTVLARNLAGHAFTAEDFRTLLALLEGITGYRLNAAEVAAFRADMIAEVEADDEDDPVDLGEIATFLATTEAEPFGRRIIRFNEVFVAAYLEEKRTRKDFSPFLATALTYNPVLARSGTTVLTTRALEARMRSVELYLEWNGASPREIGETLRQVWGEAISWFPQLPEDRRNRLMLAPERWFLLWSLSANWDTAEKAEASASARVFSGGTVPLYLGASLEWNVNFQRENAAFKALITGAARGNNISLANQFFNNLGQ